MKLGGIISFVLGLAGAIALHAFVLCFGKALFLFFVPGGEEGVATQEVELLGPEDPAAEKPKDEKKPEEDSDDEELETETEEAPDASEILRSLEASPVIDAPALDAASLGAIEQALSGNAGFASEFSSALSFASGGRIGGTGKGGALDEKLEKAFSMSEIDQRPRAVFQTAPLYPSGMRGKKVEGVVTVIFVVDAQGKVESPRAIDSTHPAFAKPALDAVKQWKFEPGVKGGQRVPCKMRVPIRFQPSQGT